MEDERHDEQMIGPVEDTAARSKAEDDLRESEARFAAVFDASPVSIAIARLEDGRLLAVNRAWEKLTGFSRAEVIGRSPIEFDLWVEPKARERMFTGLRNGNSRRDFEVQVRDKGGSLNYVLMAAEPIVMDDEECILTMAQDITHRKKLETQLNQAQKMEALGTLSAGMAHEINNPVNSIMLNAEFLQEVWKDVQPVLKELEGRSSGRTYGGVSYDYLEGNLGQLIADVGDSAARIASLITRLKNFARMSDSVEKHEIYLNDAVRNAIRLVESTTRKSGVRLETILGVGLPPLKAHQQSIEQVVVNLVLNAIQSIDHDKGGVRIETGFDRKNGRVFLSVSDNGCGIDPLIADRIYDPFVTNRQADGGSGLGLAVTHTLVRSHGGEIRFRSKQGTGTTFIASFPIGESTKIHKILIVDDDASTRKVLMQALKDDRSRIVESASGGIEGLIKLGTLKPDLLILDIFMPGLDGLDVCRKIKSSGILSDLQVMILTGMPDDAKLRAVADIGFDNIYTKPLGVHELRRKVDRILANR